VFDNSGFCDCVVGLWGCMGLGLLFFDEVVWVCYGMVGECLVMVVVSI